MNIGILARGLSEPIGGVKQYIYDISRALVKVDKENNYFLFYNDRKFINTCPEAEEVVFPVKNKFLYDHYFFPRLLKKYPIDVLFCPKCVIPLGINIKSVVTIHDLLYFPLPDKYNFKEYKFLDTMYMRFFIPRSIRKAAHIIADSENTKNDIIALFNTPPTKISVVHLGVSSFVTKDIKTNEVEAILNRFSIKKPFIFYSGTATRRKNLPVLIKALGSIKDKIPHLLVITGGGTEKNIPLKKIIEENRLTDRVRILGTVSLDVLLALYKGADMFVFPSLYEGFGLPVLEAMALGCPVICSNASSLPEVAGDAALLFDPNDVEQLAHHLLTLASNVALRNTLIEKGKARAKLFTWEKAAKKLVNIFSQVIGKE